MMFSDPTVADFGSTGQQGHGKGQQTKEKEKWRKIPGDLKKIKAFLISDFV